MTNLPITGKFRVTCEYGKKGNLWSSGYHKGIDLYCDNRNIYSTCNGTVKTVSYDKNGWGYYVRVQNDDDKHIHIFCHMLQDSIKVKVGSRVTRATVLGTMGSTGNSTGTHLHFQIEKSNTDRTVLDPTSWLGIPNKVGSYDSADYQIDEKKPEPKPTPTPAPIKKLYKDDKEIASWATKAVYNLKDLGIMNGTDTGNFNPTDAITRQEMAVALYNLINKKKYSFINKNAAAKYADDSKIASWARTAVYDLRKKGIMNGDDNNKFNPTTNITRQETAVALNRIFNKKAAGAKKTYADDKDIASWAKDAVYNLRKADIMNGVENNKFNPTRNISRQETAVCIDRLISVK